MYTNKHISEIIDIGRLSNLLDKFTNATGTGTAVLDMEANVLIATGWQDICTKFHRVQADSCKNCIESDTVMAKNLKSGESYVMYKCMNGLTDLAVPIIINNEQLGTLFIGQFLSKKPDLAFFRVQAAKFGFDEKKYLEALFKVPVIPDDEVKRKMEFLSELALFIGELGISKLGLMNLTTNLEQVVDERTKELKESQQEALNRMQDAIEARKETEVLNVNLERMMESLERSNLELEQFAYVASHDLQEPLRMVSSFTQLLERRYKDKLDQDANEFIHFAVDGANRMQKLINDLLDYSRITSRGKEFTIVDTSQVLGQTIANLQERIIETTALITNDDLPKVKADESQILRVFQNLIQNALKFSDRSRLPKIHVSCKEKNGFYEFSVSDNGIGMDMQYHDRVFTIFQRLHSKEEYPGTGIGLSICKRIVERHGGKIWFKSKVNEGTTFYFTLKT